VRERERRVNPSSSLQGSSGANSELKQYIALCCEAGEAAGLGTAGMNPVKFVCTSSCCLL